MPLRKRVGYYGLRDLSYSIVDNSENSLNFFRVLDFPEKFKAGKNLFKISGNRDTLVDGSEIHIEILDYNGNPIYYEPLKYIEKDGTRVIAVYIYPDTPPGECTVYLAGRAYRDPVTGNLYRSNKNSNDADYFLVPNVIWSRKCNIAPKASNDVEIIYTQQPKVTITEIVQPYLQPVDVYNVFTQVTGTGSVSLSSPPSVNTNVSIANSSTVEGANTTRTPSFGTQFYNSSNTRNTLSATTGTTTISPTIQTITSFSNITTTLPFFSASMTGGTLTVVNPVLTIQGNTAGKNNLVYPASQFDQTTTDYTTTTIGLSGSYEFAIIQVNNSTSARVAQIYGFANAEDTLGQFSVNLLSAGSTSTSTRDVHSYSTYVVNNFQATSNYTASFIKPSDVAYTQNSASFADIILSNIEPATGDVYRVKTLYKPSGQFGDFVDLGDTIVEQSDILIDTSSLETNVTVGSYYENFGLIESLQEINTYWTGSGLGTVSTSNPMTLTYDMDTLIGGIRMLPINTTYQQNDAVILSIKSQYYPQVYKNTEYIVKFSIANDPLIASYSSNNSNIPNARLDVYISGSNVTKQDALTFVTNGNISAVTDFNSTVINNFTDNGLLGTRIGTYQTTFTPESISYITFRFVATEDKPIDLKFVTRNGAFIIGNIQILANQETGFSPNFVRINKRIPTEHLNTPLTFKFQYYDFRGRKADTETVAYGAVFDGDNTYINGTNNLLTGSVFIGNSIGSGIEMAGVNSGYIRSIGYQGFISASTPSKGGAPGWIIYSGSVLPDSGDNYSGVGIELVTNSNNYFRYRTSPSELDIHTEKFFLGSTSQYISGANGNIAISSSNFYLDAAGNVTMAGTITAQAGTIGGFAITSTAISSSNNSLILRGNNGQITGSSVLFTGGKIGGFTISNDTLSGTGFYLSGSATNNGSSYFISSSGFNIKGNGDITGSSVLFTGGKISSFTLTNDALTAGSTFFISSSVSGTPGSAFFISSSKFNVKQDGTVTGSSALFSGSVSVVGTINALAGNIGGFNITQNAITGSGFYLSGSATGDQFFISSSNFNVKANGQITGSNVLFTGGKIAGFTISGDTLSNSNNFYISGSATGDQFFISSSAFNVKANGNITGSSVLFTGGKISSFTLTNDAFAAGSTFFISSSVSGTPGSAFFISSSKFNVKQDGTITGSSALFSGSVSVVGTVNALAGNIGGFAITSDAITGSGFYLSGSATTTGFFISSSKFNIKGNGDVTGSQVLFTGGRIASFNLTPDALVGVNSTTNTATFLISSSVDTTSPDGVAFFISSSKFNVRQDGTISGSNVLFNGGTVGGFTIDSSKITGTNIIIDSAGSLQTANYASNIAGWKISAVDNGFAEFENVKVRGTLKTAVFEKETVNAVGGQLYVANSTTITGSEAVSLTPDFVYLKFGSYSGSNAIQNIAGNNNTYLILSDLTTASLATLPVTTQTFQPIGSTGLLIASGSKPANSTTNANIATLSNINLGTSASFTIMAWVYPNFDNYTSSTPSGSIIEKTSALGFSTVGTFGIFWFSGSNWPQTGSIRTVASNTVSTATNTHLNQLYNKQWTHIAMAISGASGVNTTRRLYINGTLIDSTNSYAYRSLSNTADIRLGAGFSYTERWPGYITDVRIYTGSLTTSQIATVYSGSYFTSSIEATSAGLIVDNVTGFANGEILSAKKVNNTGFATEYVQVRDTVRLNPSSDTDFKGVLYVTRSYGNNITGNSASLGDMPNVAQSYSPSQVLVSTGKIGTGFIRINANPNDQATPYIDIVERTGSGIYDVKLKARLGDLVGLANSSYVFGSSNPGFGLATDNVFLQGGIIANTGSIGGIQMQSSKLYTGTGTFNNNNTGFYLDDSSNFSLGNKFSWNGATLTVSGTLNAVAGNIGGFSINANALSSTNFYISGSATGNDFFISASNFNVKANGNVTGSSVLFTGGKIAGFTISGDTLSNSNNFYISGSATGDQFFISASNFNVKANGNVTASSALFSGSVSITGNINAKTGNIGGFNITSDAITGSGFYLSGSATGNDFFISSSKFNIKANGDVSASSALFSGSVSITGNINARTGNIGGFNITADAITGSGFYLSGSATGDQFFISSSAFNVKANGNITGSNVLFTGGKIAGFTISGDTLSNSNNFYISGSATGDQFFISSSAFNVKANGNITGSNVLFTGGKVGGFGITSTQLSSSGFLLDASTGEFELGATSYTAGDGVYMSKASTNNFRVGDAAGARVQFTGTNLEIYNSSNTKLVSVGATNTIAGFTLSDNTLSNSNNFYISGSATGDQFFISSSNFNVKANGNITGSSVLFDGGTIGGFVLDNNRIYSSITLPSVSIPAIEFNSLNGAISGSSVLLRTRYNGVTYNLMDTNAGYADFKNIGRQVITDNTEYSRTSTSDEATSYTDIPGAAWAFNILPGETNLIINWNQLAHSATYSAVSRVRWQLQYLAAAQSGSSASSNAYYDTWTDGTTSAHTLSINANSTGSKWEVVNSTIGLDGANFTVDSYIGSVINIKLQLANDIANATGNMTTKIKNISAYTTRTYGSAAGNGR